MSTFVTVITLPPGLVATVDEVNTALQAVLDQNADGARVATRQITEDYRWADAMLDLNAELGNLG